METGEPPALWQHAPSLGAERNEPSKACLRAATVVSHAADLRVVQAAAGRASAHCRAKCESVWRVCYSMYAA